MKGIITLCGSTRFKKEFNDLNYAFTLDDRIVLSVGSFLHSDDDPEIKEEILAHKEQLDKLHKEKIMISQIVKPSNSWELMDVQTFQKVQRVS